MTDRRLLIGDPNSAPPKHGSFVDGDRLLDPAGKSIQYSMNLEGSHDVYVDKFRSDTYTADGSEYKPYKTIAAALAYIKSVAVALQDWSILIRTGQYTESVVLEDLGLLDSISLVGVGGIVGLVPAAGNAIQSTANNALIKKLRLINIEVTKPVVITGPNGGTCFVDVWCQDCKFVGTATLTLNCVNNFSLMSSYIETDISLTNVAWFYSDSARMNGALAMVCDSTLPAPSGGAGGTTFLNGVYQMGNVTLTKGGTANGVFVVMGGSRINGSSNTITNPVGWTFQAYSSFIRGNFTNNGTLQQRGAFIEKTFVNAGTWTNDTKSEQVKYAPAVVGDWAIQPTAVASALDILASSLKGEVPWEFGQNFGIDYGSVESMAVYNGRLYAGLSNTAIGAAVYAYDGSTWALSHLFPVAIETVETMAVHNGKLYVGTGQVLGQAFVYEFDGTAWALSNNFVAFTRVAALASYDGKLYAGLGDAAGNADVYEYNGIAWALNNDFGAGFNRVHALTVYNGKMYAGLGTGAGNADIWAYDGKVWTLSHNSALNQVRSLAVYNGHLYAGFGESAGMDQVWVFDGATWILNHDFGAGFIRVEYLASYNGRLYAGMGNGPNMGKIFVYDGNSWTLSHDFGLTFDQVETMHVYNGKLYAGTGRVNGDIYIFYDPLVSQLAEDFDPERVPFNEQHQNFTKDVTVGGRLGVGTSSPTSPAQVVGLPVYVNNAAALAGGLTVGAFFRIGTDPDQVCVVH